MIDYMIKKTDIYCAQIIIYDDFKRIDGIPQLIPRNLKEEETFRKVLITKDKIAIDFETGDQIFPLKYDGETKIVLCPVRRNTMYLVNLFRVEISDQDLEYAANLYKEFLRKQELIKARKLIPFPQNILTKNS